MTAAEKIVGGVATAVAQDSAREHVTGGARYIDDIPAPADLLHLAFGAAPIAAGKILSLDLSAVRAAPGVVMVVTAADIPGVNDLSPTHRHDEPVFPTERISYHGQPLFAVAAETRAAARRAALLAKIETEAGTARITPAAAREGGELVTDPLTLERGDVAGAMAKAPRRLSGRMGIGGQDHFYLEGQIALAEPGEGDDVTVWSSTQHPSEVQHMVATVLGVPQSAVTVRVRRMGGGFGGKETQGNFFAAVAALVAKRTGRAAKFRPDRDEDMTATGKRHDFEVDYEIGYDETGRIEAVEMTYAARCGWSSDLSGPVTDRALFHADNCYYFPAARLSSLPLKSNTVSATAFRGFGGPQGMVGGERLIEEIAFDLGLDPLDVRLANCYAKPGRDVTPYHQEVEQILAPQLLEALAEKADYRARRQALHEANRASPIVKRGIAITPVKFGISFTATHYNQAGALLHLYADGSLALNHGGTEMGQGLFVKVAQVVAEVFQVDLEKVRITATDTGKVPNTSATAASSGSDLNGMAALKAAETIKGRLIDFAVEHYGVPKDQVVFLPGRVRVGNQEIPFPDLAKAAYMGRVQLSSTGFYKTPDIHWDRKAGRGRPFFYFAYGAACAQAAVDTLTGEHRIERVDILHDVGSSLNPAIDRGQVEGGFVQGQGWLTSEELWWDAQGRLRTHAPSTYKIPTCGDRPRVFNVELLEGTPNPVPTVFRSKAVGEPPLMLAISVLHAISDAVASVADHRLCPRLDPPATPERVLAAIDRLKGEAW